LKSILNIESTKATKVKKFTKAQVTSLTATFIDFFITILFTEFIQIKYFISTVFGALSGAVVSFYLSRNWVFQSKEVKKRKQSIKFLFVSLGSLILNSIGTTIITETFNISYLVSKFTTATFIGIFYNFYLQQNYVFRKL
jgi:putative flippase GtrA